MYKITYKNKKEEYVCDQHIASMGIAGEEDLKAIGATQKKVADNANGGICDICGPVNDPEYTGSSLTQIGVM